jgi:hypothetical protein
VSRLLSEAFGERRARMVEARERTDVPPTGVARGPRLPRGMIGAAAILAAALVVGFCMDETPTAAYSTCGTCRGAAGEAVYWWGGLGVGMAALAALIARFEAPGEFRVARAAAVAALAFWVASVGFIRGWW